eukprot:2424874-Amphidinium_carterae.1
MVPTTLIVNTVSSIPIKLATCEFKVGQKMYSLNQNALAPSMWWILPVPLLEQRSRLRKITPHKRSDEQVAKWTEARPAGRGSSRTLRRRHPNWRAQINLSRTNEWIQHVWSAGQVEYAGPEDSNTIRFLRLNLDFIDKKHSNEELPVGGVSPSIC